MRLRIVHCDPEQTERVRAWFREHPGYELFRDTRHVMWRLSDGEEEIVGYTWAEQLDRTDAMIAGWQDTGPRACAGRLPGRGGGITGRNRPAFSPDKACEHRALTSLRSPVQTAMARAR